MLQRVRSSRDSCRWAWRVATAFAFLAQCWIALAPLAEHRGFGASAHVEAAGIDKHFAHDEATCAACAVLALHVAVPPNPIPRLVIARIDRAIVMQPDGRIGVAPLLSHSSRAPPTPAL